MGWNHLQLTQPASCGSSYPPNRGFYFVHSYYVDPVDPQVRAATVTHGSQTVTAAIARDNLMAVQFHPEKSSTAGFASLI